MIGRYLKHMHETFLKAKQRKQDETILWPSICEQSETLGHAKSHMRIHMETDSAYSNMNTVEREDYLQYLVNKERGRFP